LLPTEKPAAVVFHCVGTASQQQLRPVQSTGGHESRAVIVTVPEQQEESVIGSNESDIGLQEQEMG
jgi:hypothetical protein